MQVKNSHIFSSLCNAICCLFSAVCNAIFSISGAVCNAFSDIFSAEWNAIYIFLVQCNTIFLDFQGQCALVFSTQCEMPFSPFPVQWVLCNAIFYFFSAVSGALCISVQCIMQFTIFSVQYNISKFFRLCLWQYLAWEYGLLSMLHLSWIFSSW